MLLDLAAKAAALPDMSGAAAPSEIVLRDGRTRMELQFSTGSPVILEAAALRAAFERTYLKAYGRLLDGLAVRLLNLRLAVIGRRPKLDLKRLAPAAGGSIAAAKTGSRPMFAAGTWADTAVYDRLALPIGAEVTGPAVLEQLDTTIIVEPGQTARVDDFGNVVLA